MATQKKKNNVIEKLANHLEECPLFDIKHLEHKSLDGFIKHPENFYLKSRYMSLYSKIDPEISERAAVLANMKKQIATAKVNAQRAATIEAQKQIEATK